MSDYQVTNYGICGECKHHVFSVEYEPNGLHGGWICNNCNSDYYTDYTEYTDTCECFEQRGVE